MDNRGQVQDGNNRFNQPVDAQEAMNVAPESLQPMSQNRAQELGKVSVGQTAGFYKRSERLAQAALEQAGTGIRQGETAEQIMAGSPEAELVREETELARDEAELTNPEQFVGRQSEVQIEDGYKAEQENAHPELGFVQKIEKRSQEQIAANAMEVADNIVAHKEYRPMDLIKLRDEMSARMRQSYPVPEGMGDVA